MSPPDWALTTAARLGRTEFAAEFSTAWSQVATRFLKLECWQRYREPDGNGSQAAYERGDDAGAEALLHGEALADQPLYDEVRKRDLEYARVRLLQEPLTDYLEYELLSYRIRAQLGENIEVVRCDPALSLPNAHYFDFLLFDQHTALIHDYGAAGVGRQTGGWITHDPAVIEELEATLVKLRQNAEPLYRYLAST
jgi:hypothetical protein